jgi:hypothetical protein
MNKGMVSPMADILHWYRVGPDKYMNVMLHQIFTIGGDMGDRVNANNETFCSECGDRLASPEQGLSMDGEQTLCARCYRYLLVPNYKGTQMENID